MDRVQAIRVGVLKDWLTVQFKRQPTERELRVNNYIPSKSQQVDS